MRDVAILGLLAASVAVCAPPVTVTFYKDIAPVVYRNCAPCHRPGESAPFSLLTYDDAKRHGPQIATVTKSRYMPPWLPEAGHGEFAEERRLTEAEIQAIQTWVETGSAAGTPVRGQTPPKFSSEWQAGVPDLVLHVTKPYELQ